MSLIIFPLFFGDALYESAKININFIQGICFGLCILIYIFNKTDRKTSVLLLMVLYFVYNKIVDRFFLDIMSFNYSIEAAIMLAWSSYIMFRYEHKSDKTLNSDNIWLAFYKGENGSLLMRISSLFGESIQSVAILAGDNALYLKKNKPNFIFGNKETILRKADNYVIKDTGVKHTKDYTDKMKSYSKVVAKKGFFRVRCIEGIKELLCMIGEEFKPKTYIPSLYLRSI